MQELGPEVIKALILPQISSISARIDATADPNHNLNSSNPNVEKIAATHIKNLIIKSVPAVLKTARSPLDTVEDYKNDCGSLGVLLHAAVQRSRAQNPPQQPQQPQVRPAPIMQQQQQMPGTPTQIINAPRYINQQGIFLY